MEEQQALFQTMEIKDFRGFHERQVLKLDATAIAVVGANGTGKTSFFDAIQWLITGDLSRLRERANHRKSEYIVNQWSSTGAAEVTAELLVNGRTVQIRRRGNSEWSQFEFADQKGRVSGSEAEAQLTGLLLNRQGVTLREALASTGLLQQEDLRSVVEGHPTERFTRLTTLLGLEVLPDFERSTRLRADSLGRQASEIRRKLDQAESDLLNGEQELAGLIEKHSLAPTSVQLKDIIAASLRVNAPALELRTEFPTDTAEITLLANAARRIRDVATELLSQKKEIDTDETNSAVVAPLAPVSEDVSRLELELATSEYRLALSQTNLRDEGQVSDRLAALASFAMPLLSTVCPVCQQPIDAEEIRARLREWLDRGQTNLADLQSKVHEAQIEVNQLTKDLTYSRKELSRLEAEHARRERQELIRQEWTINYRNLIEGNELLRPVHVDTYPDVVTALSNLRDAAIEVERMARDAIAALSAQQSTSEIERLRANLADLTSEVERLRSDVVDANRESTRARVEAHAAAEASSNVTRKRLERLAPLLSEIFARLDPHPAFTSLDYDLELYRKRSAADLVAIDEESGLRVDPLLIFSTSQANVVALTFFLAASWCDGSYSMPFVLLDDPLQAMDDINALGFADLCRHIRRERQLIVSTHDRRLGGLLERKLAPRSSSERTRIMRFEGWDRSGPQVLQELVEQQLDAGNARVFTLAA